MKFKEFIEEVKNTIPDHLSQYDIEEIHIEKVFKNNGILCTGMAIRLKGESIAPNIYMEYYYKLNTSGHSMKTVMELISEEFVRAYNNLSRYTFNSVSREELDNKVFPVLINYEKNKELLKDCPHIKFLDLAIIFRFLVRKEEEGFASVLIHNQDLKKFDVTKGELYKLAKENNKRLFKPVIKSLEEVLGDLVEDANMTETLGIKVLSNEEGVNGAIYFAYEDIVREYAIKEDTDLFILPSSIHEVLLLSVNKAKDIEEIKAMVRDINEYVVDDMDFLSDEVYCYSREKGFIIA